ncbi:MAG: hypothetical protein HeimC3_15370 [Candidatus Heimdallarchaeota archaeon LC_3]|nr:MAG: hypothetical protein HeimC3_15370 [Candidatus Heimdallarchaeota archaeon LC_3]
MEKTCIKENFMDKNPIRTIFFLHTSLFLIILFLVIFYFQGDLLSTIWATFKNDSWKFIRNTIKIENPPYPYHLITTSFHYFPLYALLSNIFQPNLSLTISVIVIQYIFSLLTVVLIFMIYKELFGVNNKYLILFIWIIDTTIFSLFFVLATAEILFIFYQTLTFFLFINRKYFYSSITLGMTLALRFNGFFFILGFILIIFYSLMKKKNEINLKNWTRLVLLVLYTIISVIISLLPFIYSNLVTNDFFLPFNSEFIAYSTWETYLVDNQIVMIPFTFWNNYTSWVITTNVFTEYLLFIAALITFIIGLWSIIYLYHFRKNLGKEKILRIDFLLILGLINFLGVNTVVSGRNFSRFLSFTFPIFPIVMYFFFKSNFDNKKILLIGTIFFGLALLLNIVWWINIDYCDACQHNF